MPQATLCNFLALSRNLPQEQRTALDRDGFEPRVLRDERGGVRNIEVMNPGGPRSGNPATPADREALAKAVYDDVTTLFGSKNGVRVLTASNFIASSRFGPKMLDALMHQVDKLMPADRVILLDNIRSGDWVGTRGSFYSAVELRDMTEIIHQAVLNDPALYDRNMPLDRLQRKVGGMIDRIWHDPRRSLSRKREARDEFADNLIKGKVDGSVYSIPREFFALDEQARRALVDTACTALDSRLRDIAPSRLGVQAAMVDELKALLPPPPPLQIVARPGR
jgi:hypothetical protein